MAGTFWFHLVLGLAPAHLHSVGLQEELLLGRTGLHQPQNVSALRHLFNFAHRNDMCMLDDLNLIPGPE